VSQIYVDLSPVTQGIGVLNQNIRVVANQLDQTDARVLALAAQQAEVRHAVDVLHDSLRAELAALRDSQQRTADRQFAATQVIELRQQLEALAGPYRQARAHAAGILQAADSGLVRLESARTATESIMLTQPQYWLPPTLLALAAWFADEQKRAHQALHDALARSDSRTSLFFTLTCVRYRRYESSSTWVARYLQSQDPAALDREMIALLNALTNGVLGQAAFLKCSSLLEAWIEQIDGGCGCNQQAWRVAFDGMTPSLAAGEYPVLRASSPAWPSLERAAGAARRHAAVLSYFQQMFGDGDAVPHSVAAVVDEILDMLVNQDEDEMILRQKLREQELIVEENGDRKAARQRFLSEAGCLQPKLSLSNLLTLAALHPKQLGVSKTLRRYCVALSREGIRAAYEDLLAADRARVPLDVELACGSWRGSSRDGSEEAALAASLKSHYAARLRTATKGLGPGIAAWFGLICGIFVSCVCLVQGEVQSALGLAAITGGYFLFRHRKFIQMRNRARTSVEAERDHALRSLQAALAELADLRLEIDTNDAAASGPGQLLGALVPAECILARPRGRASSAAPSLPEDSVKQPNGTEDACFTPGAPLLEQLPPWDLMPPFALSPRRPKR
jgi:hypothetical protein